GFVFGGVRYLRNFIIVYILLIAATPKILYYPIIIKIFVQPFYFKIAFVALHAFVFIMISVISTLRNLNPDILNMCKVFGCNSPLKVYRRIFWPYAYFSFLAGLRMATISSFVGAVVADMLIAPGVGYTVRLLAYNFKVVDVYSLILLVAVFAIALNFVLLRVENKASKRLRLEQNTHYI
ncbi:MAG: ABC transporter permease subunit, partial [Thermoplasmatales archaeon]